MSVTFIFEVTEAPYENESRAIAGVSGCDDRPAHREQVEAVDFAKSAPTPVAIQRAAKEFLEGISQKVLTDSLRSMEADGIITRTVYAEVPPRVEYELSEL